MSRFYLIEFRGKRQKYWHLWARESVKKVAFENALGYFGKNDGKGLYIWRVIEIDTDLGSLTEVKP